MLWCSIVIAVKLCILQQLTISQSLRKGFMIDKIIIPAIHFLPAFWTGCHGNGIIQMQLFITKQPVTNILFSHTAGAG